MKTPNVSDITQANKLGKKEKTLIVLAVVAVILIVAYFVVSGVLRSGDGGTDETTVALESGELQDGKDILMFEHITSATLKQLDVTNSYGSYSFSYNQKYNTFLLDGDSIAPYDSTAFSNLLVNAGYAIATSRLDDPSEDLSVYGLEEGKENAKYTISTKAGKSYTVRIGGMVPTKTGFYAMLDGRNSVYTVSTSVSCLFSPVTSLLTPAIAYPVSSNDYQNVDNFAIMKNGEPFIRIDTVPPETKDGEYSYDLIYPTGYSLNIYAYSAFLEKLADLSGSAVVEFGGKNAISTDTLKSKYGIDPDNAYYMLYYTCGGIPSLTVFSEPDKDGNMYAYFTLYDIVSVINLEDADFIKWKGMYFVDNRIIGNMISDIEKITISGEINNGEEHLKADESFTLKSYLKNPDDTNEALEVRNDKTGLDYDYDSVQRFRDLYRVMLGIYLQGEADNTDISSMTKLATVTVQLEKAAGGVTSVYEFYSYSTRRCFFTVNGEGEFYCRRDDVEKLLRDVNRFVEGKPIDYDSDN